MPLGILLLVGLIAAVVGVREAMGHGGRGSGSGSGALPDGHALRRFFQFLLLYGLLVVVAVGLSELLGRLLERGTLVSAYQTGLARSLAFTIVGVPLLVVVAVWSRRRFRQVQGEASSVAWSLYVTWPHSQLSW